MSSTPESKTARIMESNKATVVKNIAIDRGSALGFDDDGAAELARVPGKKCGYCAFSRNQWTASVVSSPCAEFDCTKVKRRRLAKHGSLAREGDKLANLYSLRFGQLKAIGGKNAEQQVSGFYLPGDLIGLESIATGHHRFRLLALENCEVCEIPTSALAGLIVQHPEFQTSLIMAFSGALNDQYSRSVILSMRSLERRFAGFLLGLGQRYAHLGYSGNSFRLGMTRGDIGSYLATSIESISRLISRFNGCGVTLIQGRMVDLVNRPYLEALVRGDRELHGP